MYCIFLKREKNKILKKYFNFIENFKTMKMRNFSYSQNYQIPRAPGKNFILKMKGTCLYCF